MSDELDSASDVSAIDNFDDSTLGLDSGEADSAAVDSSADAGGADSGAADDGSNATDSAADSTDDTVQAAKDDEGSSDEANKPARSHMLPKARYDFQKQRREQAEERATTAEAEAEVLRQRLKAMEAQPSNKQAPETSVEDEIAVLESKVVDLDQEIEQLRLDGKVREAATKQSEIRKIERKIYRLENAPTPGQNIDVNELRSQAAREAQDSITLDSLVTQLEANYPELDDSSDSYNPDLLDEVMDVYDAFLAKGTRPPVALDKATTYVMGAAAGTPEAPAQTKVTDKRQAVKRNLDAARRQPPDLTSVGRNADTGGVKKPLDIMHMTIEQYEALGIDEDEFLP